MSSASNKSEEFDGSVWTNGGDMLAGKRSHAAAGTQTAAVAIGGEGTQVNCQEYNGTCWVAGGDMLGSGRKQTSAFGTLTTAIVMGGHGYLTTAEQYDATCWSAVDSMSVGKANFAAFGSAGTGLAAAGQASSGAVTTNEKYGESVAARTVTDS